MDVLGSECSVSLIQDSGFACNMKVNPHHAFPNQLFLIIITIFSFYH